MGIGIPRKSPLPRNLNPELNPDIGIPSVNPSVKLLAIAIIASVTMKGCILPFDIIIPFIVPIAAPTNKPTIIPSIGFPALTILDIITALSANVDPTDKSIPPVIITSVIPNPIIDIIEVCLNMLDMLYMLKKLSDIMDSIMNIPIKPTNAGFFLKNVKILFFVIFCQPRSCF